MARGKSEKENSGGKKGKEGGVPPASTDQNTGELSSDESSDESAYEWESDREKKKDLSHDSLIPRTHNNVSSGLIQEKQRLNKRMKKELDHHSY